MTEPLPLLWALAAGVGLGFVYFYGLWLTVRLVVSRRTPAWLLLSALVRLTILLVGLYALGQGDWRRLVAAMGGILLVRVAMTRRLTAMQALRGEGASS